MVSGVLGRHDWLRSLIDGRFADHNFTLLEDGEVVQTVTSDSPKSAGEWSVELPVAVKNARWALQVAPTQEYVQSTRSPLPEAALVIGTLLSILLALATYLFQSAFRRARELNEANLRLTQDNARRHHAEQQLRESEQRTQLIINSVKDCAIYMLDTDGNIASWNAGAQALNGYTAAEIMGQHFSVLYPPDRKIPPEQELVVATRRGWFEEECWHLRKDGTQYCGDDMISAIRDEQTQLRGFAVITRDATLRIELREQTERARDHYLSLFSSFPEPRLAIERGRRVRLPEPGVAGLHRSDHGRPERKRLAGRRAPGRSRGMARKNRSRFSHPTAFRARIPPAASRWHVRLDDLQRPALQRLAGTVRRLPVLVLRQHREARNRKRPEGKRGALSAHDHQRSRHGLQAGAHGRPFPPLSVRQPGKPCGNGARSGPHPRECRRRSSTS